MRNQESFLMIEKGSGSITSILTNFNSDKVYQGYWWTVIILNIWCTKWSKLTTNNDCNGICQLRLSYLNCTPSVYVWECWFSSPHTTQLASVSIKVLSKHLIMTLLPGFKSMYWMQSCKPYHFYRRGTWICSVASSLINKQTFIGYAWRSGHVFPFLFFCMRILKGINTLYENHEIVQSNPVILSFDTTLRNKRRTTSTIFCLKDHFLFDQLRTSFEISHYQHIHRRGMLIYFCDVLHVEESDVLLFIFQCRMKFQWTTKWLHIRRCINFIEQKLTIHLLDLKKIVTKLKHDIHLSSWVANSRGGYKDGNKKKKYMYISVNDQSAVRLSQSNERRPVHSKGWTVLY